MIETEFLAQLDRFNLVVSKRVTSTYSGPRRSIAAGRGLVFKDYRAYSPGDDTRLIDWKIFARTDNLYVKNYEEERNLTVHVIIDSSSSMNYGKPVTKFDYGSMIGVGFAYLAMKENEKFQFSTFAESLEVFQAKRGMSQLANMVQYLNNIKTKGHSKLHDSIRQYKKLVGSKSMLILISDFLINIEEVRDAFYLLGDHEIKIIQVLDPVEKDLKMQGDFKLEDSETSEKLRTYISPRMRDSYQRMLERHTENVREVCDKLGIKFYQITTDVPVFDAFYMLLE